MSKENSPANDRQKCFVAFSKSAKWNEDLLAACEEVLSRPEFNLELDYAGKSVYLSGSLQQKALILIANARYGIYDLSCWEDEQGQWQLPRNVFVELGMAIALNRPMLMLRNDCNHHLELPQCLESMKGMILEFGGLTTLKRTLERRLPQWLNAPPEVDWWNRYCVPGNRTCEFRESHPSSNQWGRKNIQCHVSDGPDPGQVDFRALVDDVLGRFSDVSVTYMDTLLPMQGYDFLLCTHCKTVRSSSFAIYRITPSTPAETFIAIGLSLGLEHLFNYRIPKLLLTEDPDELPSLLKGYEAVVARNDSERKTELLKFMPAVMQQVRASSWKPRPLPFVEISSPKIEMPEKSEPDPAEASKVEKRTQALSQNPSVAFTRCGFCGGQIRADDIFCAHCAARQPIVPPGVLTGLPPPPRLSVVAADQLYPFILQKKDNLIGRTDASSHVFPDINLSRFDPNATVSRRHGRIFTANDSYFIEDLGSINGIVLNSKRKLPPRKSFRLHHGDQLRIGEITLVFLNESESPDDDDIEFLGARADGG